jgi:hypothetical protein
MSLNLAGGGWLSRFGWEIWTNLEVAADERALHLPVVDRGRAFDAHFASGFGVVFGHLLGSLNREVEEQRKGDRF